MYVLTYKCVAYYYFDMNCIRLSSQIKTERRSRENCAIKEQLVLYVVVLYKQTNTSPVLYYNGVKEREILDLEQHITAKLGGRTA